ncbi:MAG: heme o synthase [Flammeovirgaceae bacterium]|nr:heme o synthase [Flammeovirgaceae bacterium]MDW8287403.1 heme o synthase [Flammeovirgaceae bacterium]
MNTTVLQVASSSKIRYYIALLKLRLTTTVVFSGTFGYLMASGQKTDWLRVLLFAIGSFCITGAANVINQVIEKDIDKKMRRTKDRPLPTGVLNLQEAVLFASVLCIMGTATLALFLNVITAGFALLSLVLYGFVYTPLKQINPIAVLVGAFPGALPPLIGWVAVTGKVSMEAIVLFAIQFVWQFPHFWAIAWLGDDDYRKAGLKMLPSSGKSAYTSLQMTLYTMLLVPLGLLPRYIGMTGIASAIVVTVCSLFFLWQNIRLVLENSSKAALRIMFTSFFYLPIVQLAFLLDKS